MTEEKLDPRRKTASKGRTIGLVLAVLGIGVVVLWLVRQPIAELIARSVCEGQKLSCQLSISRLDFGGVTLTNLDARAPGSVEAGLSANEVVIDLAWDGLFSPRPSSVSGNGVVVRLDLTGRGPLLGDLDTAVASFTQPSDSPPGPSPKLDFSDIRIVGDTLSGQLVATAKVSATDTGAITFEASAPAASLGIGGATVALAGASASAVVAGKQISAALKLDLSRFESANANLQDVKIDLSLEQDGRVLKGKGEASLGSGEISGNQLRNAQARGSVEAAAIDSAAFSLGQWLADVSRLELTASTADGAAYGVSWNSSSLTAQIAPEASGGSGGDFAFSAEDLRTPQAIAGKLDVAGSIAIDNGRAGSATGTVQARSVALTEPQRASIVANVTDPLAPVLPAFADAAKTAINRATQAFDMDASWTATASKTLDLALVDKVTLQAASGLAMQLAPRDGQTEIAGYSSLDDGSWRGAGDLRLSGGGFPALHLAIDRAELGRGSIALEGALALAPWKIGGDSIAIDLSGLTLQADRAAGSASGGLKVSLEGGLGGGKWKGVHADSRVSASWTGDHFIANAPDGARIAWAEAVYGDTRFGAGQIYYAPTGPLAEGAGDSLAGRGALSEMSVPVSASGFTAETTLGATAINWNTASSGFHAAFDMQPSTVDLKLDQEAIAIAMDDIKGDLELRRGWKVAGAVSGGVVHSSAAVLSDLSGKFDLAGVGDQISGSLSDVTTKIRDALEGNEKRYEEASFTGGAKLALGIVDFNGRVTLADPGVQIAQISGRHSLGDNTGSLTFDRTPLIFARRSFQPYHLSPLLLGPAGVTGRVDIAGGASWGNDELKAHATLDLRKVGFVLASAGAFEGVSGHVEVSDLLAMKSEPGQRLTIDKVTLGLPIENGVIDFQLIGSQAIRLQSAEWPFVGGFIRVKPTDFAFASTAENVVVAQAVDWDLASLVKRFEIPDLKLQGKVRGDFPVVFSAGSAEIDNAVLAASGPGVIQYASSATDAAAQSEPTTGMVMDALKDFRFEVLKIGLDGNLAGAMILTLDMLGRNPAVMNGQAFQLNISIDSELAKLVNSLAQSSDVRAITGLQPGNGGGDRQ
ncbi:MAG: YdbH domain-containing protein [Hyphomonadaceae bacterium]